MLRGTSREYYKRSGDSFYAMEHFDLADMFGKRLRPDLYLRWRLAHISFSQDESYKFAIILGLGNRGRGLGHYPLFRIEAMSGANVFHYGLDGNGQQGFPMLQGDRVGYFTFAGGENHAIHPSTTLEITALGLFEVSSRADIRFNLTIAAEDVDAKTQAIEIRAETLREILRDPTKRHE